MKVEELTDAQRREVLSGNAHITRFSDASTFDEVCILCGARDDPIRLYGVDMLATMECHVGMKLRAEIREMRND